MDTRASFTILLLLFGISLANPVRKPENPEFIAIPGNVDITTKLLETNKESSERLIQGDLILPKTKNALYCLNNNCFWNKNIKNLVEVPYIVSKNYTTAEISIIKNAMSVFHNKTCIRFVPRVNQTDYISIENKDGCYSYLGRIGGQQVLSLKKVGCLYHGIIQHELNHALGFYHEHTRSDRDKYVKINWQYIPTNVAHNFQKQNTNNQNTTYDYGSIMHYGNTAFSNVTGKYTITPIPNATVPIGQRQNMSNLDIVRIKKLYGCV
ncbi:hatching enzyme 1.2-like [Garra rufa]|uniref:hatching enzyme 1.2-like n=1 Tax=Garra rufa TaxID=137080 RepID=UPI003CCEB4A7